MSQVEENSKVLGTRYLNPSEIVWLVQLCFDMSNRPDPLHCVEYHSKLSRLQALLASCKNSSFVQMCVQRARNGVLMWEPVLRLRWAVPWTAAIEERVTRLEAVPHTVWVEIRPKGEQLGTAIFEP